MSTITFAQKQVLIHCYKCSIAFSVPESFDEQRLKDRQSFYCPAGHCQHYLGKSELQKAQDELTRTKHLLEQEQERSRRNREEAERINRRLNATRGVVTRHKKRIAAGKCPCCSKEFKDLGSHMQNRHPNWNPEKEAEVRGG